MPRIMSIARRSPVRSSNVRCSVTESGTSDPLRAVSVAIGASHSSLLSARRDPPGRLGAWPPARDRRRGSCRIASKVTLRRVEHSARVRLTRLRWRMRGAWLWPAFFALCAVDGALIALLPPFDGAPEDPIGAVLMAGFANLIVIAVLGPLAARALRRRRPDLPRVVAYDYAGTALVLAVSVLILAAGLLHRPAVVAERS